MLPQPRRPPVSWCAGSAPHPRRRRPSHALPCPMGCSIAATFTLPSTTRRRSSPCSVFVIALPARTHQDDHVGEFRGPLPQGSRRRVSGQVRRSITAFAEVQPPGGYRVGEVASALQKCIRRGLADTRSSGPRSSISPATANTSSKAQDHRERGRGTGRPLGRADDLSPFTSAGWSSAKRRTAATSRSVCSSCMRPLPRQLPQVAPG